MIIMVELADLPGVGEKTAEKLRDALGGLFFLGGAVGEQAFLFVDDHQIFVLVNNLEPLAVEAFLGVRLAYLDLHARLQLEVELRGTFPVDADVAVGEHVFHTGTADAVHLTHEELHQRRWLRDLELQGVFFGVGVFIHDHLHENPRQK